MNSGMWAHRVLAAGAVVGLACGAAMGQYGRPKVKTTPGRTAVEVPIVDRVQDHDWILTVTVGVRLDQFEKDNNGMPKALAITFDSASVVFPVNTETASSVAAPVLPSDGGEKGKKYATGKLMLNERVVDDNPTYLPDYPCGTRLGKWVARDLSGQEMSLEVSIPVTCYQTIFDEARAKNLPWPDQWPGAAA